MNTYPLNPGSNKVPNRLPRRKNSANAKNGSELSDRLLWMEAGWRIQTAEASALLRVLMDYQKHLSTQVPELPDPLQRFLAYRKENLHFQLEAIEDSDPPHAARLQQMIDENCVTFPFNYE
jgi:hypothetical protein